MTTRLEDADDATLVRACREGRAVAWRVLVARYQRLVFAIATRAGLDHGRAADVFQGVFERLHANLARIDNPERLSAWITTTAKREALRQRARVQREVSLEASEEGGLELASDDPLPDAELQRLQSLNELRQGMDRLDDRCRRLLTAVFQDPDDQPAYRSIAERLGMPVGSLGPTRARCLDKLRRLMTGSDG